MAIFGSFWYTCRHTVALLHWNHGFLCLLSDISVPPVCTHGVYTHVDLTLLSMEMIPNTQILKISAVASLGVRTFFSLKRKKWAERKKNPLCSVWITFLNLYQQITIRLLWNWNMMLTGYQNISGLLLMTFWKKIDGRMKISWNFMKKSCGSRKVFKKSSEVNQGRFNNPLTSYFGFITIWWVFSILG